MKGVLHIWLMSMDALGEKPAVVLTTLGPGATNALTGIANAFQDKSPVVMISGQSATTTPVEDTHQRLDLETNIWFDI